VWEIKRVRSEWVEWKGGSLAKEERGCPGNEGRGKAKELEGVEKLCRVHVIKKPLDIKEEGYGDMAMVNGGLGEVGKVCSPIDGRAVVTAAKLEWAEELVCVEIIHEVSCNDLFQEFATGF
jgi:hypothetical protein